MAFMKKSLFALLLPSPLLIICLTALLADPVLVGARRLVEEIPKPEIPKLPELPKFEVPKFPEIPKTEACPSYLNSQSLSCPRF
ncbi:unnamed protein product [Brassica napus]|uniref:(rape) hypothetical protein n=1 Tax=Brassica napus TaxID=3708 RepID=A0A816J264_BRANA|nr:unnamed protein product [Brassica napus]